MQKFAANFYFFKVFCRKNSENYYFNQLLKCAAPKRWSKYTTYIFFHENVHTKSGSFETCLNWSCFSDSCQCCSSWIPTSKDISPETGGRTQLGADPDWDVIPLHFLPVIQNHSRPVRAGGVQSFRETGT